VQLQLDFIQVSGFRLQPSLRLNQNWFRAPGRFWAIS